MFFLYCIIKILASSLPILGTHSQSHLTEPILSHITLSKVTWLLK